MSFAAYSSLWYEHERHEMTIAKVVIIVRCQKPLVIAVSGFMPSLDMKYLTRVSLFGR